MDAEEVNIIIAEDNPGHASLIMKNLKRVGFKDNFIHLKDGQETLDFLFRRGDGPHLEPEKTYLLLLDIKMPKVDGTEVLHQIKQDKELCKIPVIMLTTTDDPREIEHCHSLGCSIYITKPIDYDNFVDSIKKLGLFLLVVSIPKVNAEE